MRVLTSSAARQLLTITSTLTIARAFSFTSVASSSSKLALGLFTLHFSSFHFLQHRSFCSSLPLTAAAANTNTHNTMSTEEEDPIDPEYPGTAVLRLRNIQARVKSLSPTDLSADWELVRRRILWAGGLKDLQNVAPGQGYTGHSFNDFNHVDLCAMRSTVTHSENNGRVSGIHMSNRLGTGILAASDPELGPGGSWSTCMIGCQKDPPQDVAHVQFQSRIAFKLVWVPPTFERFVLVDDAGDLLNQGRPTGMTLPSLSERRQNYRVVQGSRFSYVADAIAKQQERELLDGTDGDSHGNSSSGNNTIRQNSV